MDVTIQAFAVQKCAVAQEKTRWDQIFEADFMELLVPQTESSLSGVKAHSQQ